MKKTDRYLPPNTLPERHVNIFALGVAVFNEPNARAAEEDLSRFAESNIVLRFELEFSALGANDVFDSHFTDSSTFPQGVTKFLHCSRPVNSSQFAAVERIDAIL